MSQIHAHVGPSPIHPHKTCRSVNRRFSLQRTRGSSPQERALRPSPCGYQPVTFRRSWSPFPRPQHQSPPCAPGPVWFSRHCWREKSRRWWTMSSSCCQPLQHLREPIRPWAALEIPWLKFSCGQRPSVNQPDRFIYSFHQRFRVSPLSLFGIVLILFLRGIRFAKRFAEMNLK